MNKHHVIRQWFALAVVTVSVVLMLVSILSGQSHVNTDAAAEELGRRVEQRMDILDGFITQAGSQPAAEWMSLPGLPEDMVVYKYVEDTLQSWAHQFPLRSDDLRPSAMVQRLGDSRGFIVSPLTQVGEGLSYLNFGPKWYMMKSVQFNGFKLVAGLEVVNELNNDPLNGINPRLRMNPRYSIQSISASAGSPVSVNGTPMFKLEADTASEPERHNPVLFWLAIVFFLLGSLQFLSSRPGWIRLAVVVIVQIAAIAGLYVYGRHLGGVSQLFSPLLYADGGFRYSLGAVVLVNLLVCALVMSLYLCRWSLLRVVRRRNSKALDAVLLALGLALVACIVLYLHAGFRSIGLNSEICLELFKIQLVDRYTAVVYVSFLLLSLTLPLILQMMSPLVRGLFGLRYDAFSRGSRMLFGIAVAAYFVSVSSVMGFRKEQGRVDVWANRLAMDRDITLEIQLRLVEEQIAGDQVIGALSVLDNSNELIRGRLANTHLVRVSQEYDIVPLILTASAAHENLYRSRITEGSRLAPDSRFFYSIGADGHSRYCGVFTYYMGSAGASSLMITVEAKSNRGDRGYLSLLGISEPGRAVLPPVYSYAKYLEDRLVSFKGEYAYPTVISSRLTQELLKNPDGHFSSAGYIHFYKAVMGDEVIVISRETTGWITFVVEAVLFAILAFLLLTLLTFRVRRARKSNHSTYYSNRINLVMYVSLTITLIVMSVFSVYFVYRRNNADRQSVMTSRINTIQSMLQGRMRNVYTIDDLRSQDISTAVDRAGANLKCDVSLYSATGKLVMSTTPEVFDRRILGFRINEDAYKGIIYDHKRYVVLPETIRSRHYYALYAPLFNGEGEMVAIVCSPYTDQSYDLRTEALSHIAAVITVFLLLLLLTRFITAEVVERIFRPLSEMSRKMAVGDVDRLEHIEYNQEDELTSLVQSYNRMVTDLSESTRRLAQAERDRTWTSMARQIAHEIKNPLTPIKLNLQMLIRMKEAGNPKWEDKFDVVSTTILEHVDVLADTAEAFSSLAKLSSETPVVIDLDALLRQEVSLFGSREDIDIKYLGLEGAQIEGPKPQVTRVLVNIITNAVQALEGREDGKILLSVRNSEQEGFYDIVVEDNGPGVKEEEREKIFLPQFTTKSSGSGLGLAICRAIIQRCQGTITCTKSFALGGACFIIRYPKLK